MTAKGIYEAVLTEMNKLQAPSITLEDFNYFANKAISQYINKRYNIYDVNQQTTDDLRVLKATTMLTPTKPAVYSEEQDEKLLKSLYGATYEIDLPDDYLHVLNCVCVFKVNHQHGCHNAGDYYQVGASRLTADAWSQIINNFYMKPSYKRPYYYIHNVNTETNTPTNPIVLNNNGQIVSGTDYSNSSNTSITKFKYILRGGKIDGAALDDFIPERDKINDLTKFTTSNSDTLVVEPKGAMFIILAVPVNSTVESIREVAAGDQMSLYTNRHYVPEPIINYTTDYGDPATVKLIYLGCNQALTGSYTIKIK